MHSIGTECELHLPDGSQPLKTLDEQVRKSPLWFMFAIFLLGIPMHSIGTDCELHLPDGSQPPKTLDEQVKCSRLQNVHAAGHPHARHWHRLQTSKTLYEQVC